jgi:hypothetical protein
MPPTETQIRRLAWVCRDRLGNPRLLTALDGYPESLALCIIDAIQSTGVTGASVKKVLGRYRGHRLAQGGDPESDGAVALLGTFHDLGSAEMWARMIGNPTRTSTEPDAPLRATAIEAVATAISDVEIYSAADLREIARYADLTATLHAVWTGVVGQRSGVSWRCVLMLAGVPTLAPDRILIRFVASALGLDPAAVEPEFAAEAIGRAAADLAVSPTALDHGAWRWQRAR